jgi:carbonic anhydrase
MSCNLKNIGPVNLISTDENITNCDNTTCKLTYNFGLSRCGLTNKGDYLKIKTDGNNTLKFSNLGNLTISETRLYKPALNKINNKIYDAEIIIHCTTEDSSNFLICIPIETNNNGGISNDWFSFLTNCQTDIDSSVDINKNNFTMNDLLPKGSFYYCVNITMPWICNNSDKMIIFKKPTTMDEKIKNILNSAIKPHKHTLKSITGRTTIYYNSEGTSANIGNNQGNSMTCVPIGMNGEPLIGKDSNSGFSLEDVNGMRIDVDQEEIKKNSKKQWERMLAIIWIVVGILLFCSIVLIILYVSNKFSNKKIKGTAS